MNQNIISLPNGYDRKKKPEILRFRRMTVEEAKKLTPGQRVWFASVQGTARQVTINGKPQTWKTRPSEVKVPLKYGMYEYGYATHDHSAPGFVTLLLVSEEEIKNELDVVERGG